MPLLPSSYHPPPGLAGGHSQTLFAALCRRPPVVPFQRERIPTPDGDYLDLDWTGNAGRRLAVLSHGLEGHSRQPYIRGMSIALLRRNWDVLAWNCRGCSGEPNRLPRAYHSGATEDLDLTVRHALRTTRHQHVVLAGFSLGGNLTLKYLGETGDAIDSRIRAAVAFSVPCDLAASSRQLARPSNRIYMARFLFSLRSKIREKAQRFPGRIDAAGLRRIRTFRQFDDRFTAPLHGFRDAADYWARCSCRPFLPGIRVPTLLVNARNDPFLAPSCFPLDEARDHPNLHLETPDSGGHVGFVDFNPAGEYWSETRAAAFFDQC